MSRAPGKAKSAGARSVWRIFAIPTVIAVLSLVGLLSALTGDGLRDVVSWIALAAPVAAFIVSICFRRR